MRLAIIGTVGVPANYGGFETLAENLVKYHHAAALDCHLTVYCSTRAYPAKQRTYLSAHLRYVPLNANGPQSILYDLWSLASAIWNRSDAVLLLGVPGALTLPLVRLFSSVRIVTNIDGIEWRRAKWSRLGRHLLRSLEGIAVRYSNYIIADNAAIADYVRTAYGMESRVIAYGGDHAVAAQAASVTECHLPGSYALSICRIEPENNVHMVVDAFSRLAACSLIVVGNWNSTDYGRSIRERFAGCSNLHLLDPIYDLGKLKTLRSQASLYVHGHSAGGTNPSLVEAMHFGRAVIAFDCEFNRYTTENMALYFSTADELVRQVESLTEPLAREIGRRMIEIANRRYRWDIVAEQYFALLADRAS